MGVGKKRLITIHGRKTGICVEGLFWTGLKEIAAQKNMTITHLVEEIDGGRTHTNLSSAIRVFVLEHYCRSQKDLTGAGSLI
jgi:predicted DNA-binding ribbon-helix-helix protein